MIHTESHLKFLVPGCLQLFPPVRVSYLLPFDESLDWETSDLSPDSMHILPVNFSTEHKQMLGHLHMVVSKCHLAIPQEHNKVLTSLRTAYTEELNLKKEQTSYDDLLDSLRLSLKGYKLK